MNAAVSLEDELLVGTCFQVMQVDSSGRFTGTAEYVCTKCGHLDAPCSCAQVRPFEEQH